LDGLRAKVRGGDKCSGIDYEYDCDYEYDYEYEYEYERGERFSTNAQATRKGQQGSRRDLSS
jgi:hypothetical protein